MMISSLPLRYAKALFMLALERHMLERVTEDLAGFKAALNQVKKLRAFLLAPEISRHRKIELVKILGKDRFSPLFYHFLIFLVQKGRHIYFNEIDSEFQRLREKHFNILPATVTTATPLTEENKSAMAATLEQIFSAKIKLDTRVNPDLLGGMQVRIEGKVFDNTLQRQIGRLKEQMQKKSY